MPGIAIARVDWLDPRAVPLRDAMDAEMGSLYGPAMASRPPEDVEIIRKALAVDPSTVIATVLATVDGVARRRWVCGPGAGWAVVTAAIHPRTDAVTKAEVRMMTPR
ncbi:MAG: hypothetical protein V4479_06585 [Actinomycetota bacterium]